MIDIEKTIKKYNYSINELKQSSEKLVIWICGNCGIEIDKKFRLAKRNKLCIVCSNKINSHKNIELRANKIKEYWKTHEHSRTGVKHTLESRNKMSKARVGKPSNISEEARERFRQICVERNKTEAMREAHRKAVTGRKSSEETKKKISLNHANICGKNNPFFGKHHTTQSKEKISKKLKGKMSGKNNPSYGKPMRQSLRFSFTDKNGKSILFRSSYEIRYAEYLNANNLLWEYEPKFFPVRFLKNNVVIDGAYTPDFYLKDSDEYVEIKGFWRGHGKHKYEAFCEQYPEIKIKVLMKGDLKNMGIHVK